MTSEPFLTLGFAAVDWIEHFLVHGPGDVQGQQIELDDELAAFVVKAYRVDSTGARLVRRAFLSRAKGRNKSGLAAMLACFEALGPCRFDHWAEPGEISPWGYEYEVDEPVGVPLSYVEVLNVATEEGQAGNTYDAIHYMLNPETCSPELLAEFGRIDVGLTRTILPGKRGFIEPVTSADSSKDGAKSTFIVADETHLWLLPRLKRLHGIMTRNLLKRKAASGWMLETSTMYAEGEDSVAEGTHAYAKLHRRDGKLLFDHQQASDKWDLNDPDGRVAALTEAYGPAAEWMNLAAISDSWDDPQVSEGEFRRFWLNQPVPVVEIQTVIPMRSWNDRADLSSEPAPFVGPVWLSVDADPDRLRATIVAVGARASGPPLVEVTSDRNGFSDNREGVDWALARIVAIAGGRKVAGVVVDEASAAATLIRPLRRAGLRVLATNTRKLTAACGEFYDAVVETGDVVHLADPLLIAALRGAVKRNLLNDWAWNRRTSSDDITPLVAATLALWAHKNIRADEFVAPGRLG